MSPHFCAVQEDALLLLAHAKHGNKWIQIAKMVGGRLVSPNPPISSVPHDFERMCYQAHSCLSQAEPAEQFLLL